MADLNLTGSDRGNDKTDAVPKPEIFRAKLPDVAQGLTDQELQKKADTLAYNDAMSGAAEGRIAGNVNVTAAGTEEQQRKKEEREQEALFAALTFEQAMGRLADQARQLHQDCDQLKRRFDAQKIETDEALVKMNKEIFDLKQKQIEQQRELEQLQQKLAGATGEERKALEQEITLKKAELANTGKVLNLYTQSSAEVGAELRESGLQVRQAKEKIEILEHKIEQAKRSGDQSKLEELKKQLDGAQESLQGAQKSVDKLHKDTEFLNKTLKLTTADNSAKYAGLTTQQKIDLNMAQTGLFGTIIAASKDKTVDSRELEAIATQAKAAGMNQSEMKNFAQDLADSGLGVTDKDGKSIISDNVSSYVMDRWAELEAQKQVVETTLAETAAQTKAAEQSVAQSDQTIAKTAALIQEKTTTGSEDAQIAAKVAVAAVTDKMTLKPEIIKDAQGNAVYIDRSGQADSYYYMDANGQRVTYAADDLQVENFKKGLDGGTPLASAVPVSSMQSSPVAALLGIPPAQTSPPASVKIFANDSMDTTVSLARVEQTQAEAKKVESSAQLTNLAAQSAALETIKADIEADQKALVASEGKASDQQETTHLELTVPKQSLAEIRAEENKAIARIEDAARSGHPISREEAEKLRAVLGEDQLAELLHKNNVKVEEPTLANTLGIPEILGGAGTRQMIRSAAALSAVPHVVQNVQAANYESFADSPQFSAYNDPKTVEPSYVGAVARSNVIDAAEKFTIARDNTPAAGAATPSPPAMDGLTVLERLRLLAEQQQALSMGGSMGAA